MKTIEISIQPLTPILTGGADRTTDRLHETGIIGSLRWWYEAIVRGLGRSACNPTKTECRYDGELCDVCQVFGATGWRRRFDMRIVQDETRPAWGGDVILNIRPPERSRGWFLPAGRVGNFTLKIRGDADVVCSLASLFLFLEQWGAIGAKPQLGCGFFKITNQSAVQRCASDRRGAASENDRSELSDLRYWVSEAINQDNVRRCASNNRSEPFDTRHWFFFRFRFKPSRDDWWTRLGGLQRLLGDRKTAPIVSHLAEQGMVPVSPVMKNRWRFVEWDAPFEAKRWLFGSSTGEDRLRSRVSVSWAYREGGVWVVRGWASIPEEEQTKSGVVPHRRDIDLLEKMIMDESIWKKALNLDYSTPTDLNVYRLTDRDIIRFMEG